MSKRKVIRRHFWQTTNLFVENAVSNNIVLFQALGLCPIIAAGVTLQNGVALTVCSAAVLLPLSFVIALVGNHLPKWVRPALYVVLASLLLVGMAFLLGQYVSPELYARLYVFIPLMAVNMVYSRSVGLSRVINPVATIVDALGSTVGFGLVICVISALREIAISNSLWGIQIGSGVTLPEAAAPFSAFIMLGFMSAWLQWSRQHITAYFRKKEEEHT